MYGFLTLPRDGTLLLRIHVSREYLCHNPCSIQPYITQVTHTNACARLNSIVRRKESLADQDMLFLEWLHWHNQKMNSILLINLRKVERRNNHKPLTVCIFFLHILNLNVLISFPKTHKRTLFKRIFSKISSVGTCLQTPIVLLGHRKNNRFYLGA